MWARSPRAVFLGGRDTDICPCGTGPWTDPAYNPQIKTHMVRRQRLRGARYGGREDASRGAQALTVVATPPAPHPSRARRFAQVHANTVGDLVALGKAGGRGGGRGPAASRGGEAGGGAERGG